MMPSQIIHLAIAQKYLQKHPHAVKDVRKFFDGNVLPDLANDKAQSHCGIRTEMFDIVKRNREKVSPAKFAATHDMADDLNKGQYLHLYVDNKYYNDFLLKYFQQRLSGERIGTDMYETSRRDDAYLQQKYGVAYGDTHLESELRKINEIWDEENAIKRRQVGYEFTFPYGIKDLETFIDKMSDAQIPQGK